MDITCTRAHTRFAGLWSVTRTYKRKPDTGLTSSDNLNAAVKEVLDKSKKCRAVAKTRSLRRHLRAMILIDTPVKNALEAEYSVQLAKHTHTRRPLNWTAGGRQGGGERARKDGGWNGARGGVGEGTRGGSEESMMWGRVGAGVEEGREGSGRERVRKERSYALTERGKDGREEASGGGGRVQRNGARERYMEDQGKKGDREGGKRQGMYPDEDTDQYTGHKTTHNATLALETLVLEMKYSELYCDAS